MVQCSSIWVRILYKTTICGVVASCLWLLTGCAGHAEEENIQQLNPYDTQRSLPVPRDNDEGYYYAPVYNTGSSRGYVTRENPDNPPPTYYQDNDSEYVSPNNSNSDADNQAPDDDYVQPYYY